MIGKGGLGSSVARVRPTAAPGARNLSVESAPGALRLPGLRLLLVRWDWTPNRPATQNWGDVATTPRADRICPHADPKTACMAFFTRHAGYFCRRAG